MLSQNDDINMVLSQDNRRPLQNSTASKQKLAAGHMPSQVFGSRLLSSTKLGNYASQSSQSEYLAMVGASNQTQELQTALEDVVEENSHVFSFVLCLSL
jgi:hypothetical protein